MTRKIPENWPSDLIGKIGYDDRWPQLGSVPQAVILVIASIAQHRYNGLQAVEQLWLSNNFETQNGDYLETFDSVKCAILKSHY